MTPKTDFVSTDWLADHLHDVVVVDMAWQVGGFTPEGARGKKTNLDFYREGHIPGSRPLDHDRLGSPNLPHLRTSGVKLSYPSGTQFAAAVGALGIDAETLVVISDSYGGHMGAPRGWWLFKTNGHPDVWILEGGFNKWRAEGYPVETGLPPEFSPRTYIPGPLEGRIADYRMMTSLMHRPAFQAVDLREEEELYDPAERIPGARNVPWYTLLTQAATEGANWLVFQSETGMREAIDRAGVNLAFPTISTCRFGMMSYNWPLVVRKLTGDYERLDPVYPGGWQEFSFLRAEEERKTLCHPTPAPTGGFQRRFRTGG